MQVLFDELAERADVRDKVSRSRGLAGQPDSYYVQRLSDPRHLSRERVLGGKLLYEATGCDVAER